MAITILPVQCATLCIGPTSKHFI